MKNYKAFYIINALTDDELTLFESFLKSPYFNTRKKPIELFQLIKKYKNKSDITKQKVFSKLYPGKKFNSNTFNDLMSQLHKLAEEFLYAEINKTDKIKMDVALLDKYLQGRFKHLFENKKKQLDKYMRENEKLDSFYFWYSYLKDAYELNFIQTYKDIKTKKDVNKITSLLFKTFTSIMNIAHEETMTIFVQAESRKNDLTHPLCLSTVKNITLKMFDSEILNLLKNHNQYHYNTELLKKLLNTFLFKREENSYYEYKNTIQKYSNSLTKDQMVFHYSYLISICRDLIITDSSDNKFGNEFQRLFNETLEKKLYSSVKVNYIRPKLYGSFLDSFFLQKNIGAIEEMITKCVPLLEDKYVGFYKNLSISYIYFLSKNYDKALEQIKDVNIHFRVNSPHFKQYIIQLHFLLDNYEQLLNYADSYLKILNKGAKANSKTPQRINFLKYLKSVSLAKNKMDEDSLRYLLTKIKEEKEISNKYWLIETIEEILKEKK